MTTTVPETADINSIERMFEFNSDVEENLNKLNLNTTHGTIYSETTTDTGANLPIMEGIYTATQTSPVAPEQSISEDSQSQSVLNMAQMHSQVFTETSAGMMTKLNETQDSSNFNQDLKSNSNTSERSESHCHLENSNLLNNSNTSNCTSQSEVSMWKNPPVQLLNQMNGKLAENIKNVVNNNIINQNCNQNQNQIHTNNVTAGPSGVQHGQSSTIESGSNVLDQQIRGLADVKIDSLIDNISAKAAAALNTTNTNTNTVTTNTFTTVTTGTSQEPVTFSMDDNDDDIESEQADLDSNMCLDLTEKAANILLENSVLLDNLDKLDLEGSDLLNCTELANNSALLEALDLCGNKFKGNNHNKGGPGPGVDRRTNYVNDTSSHCQGQSTNVSTITHNMNKTNSNYPHVTVPLPSPKDLDQNSNLLNSSLLNLSALLDTDTEFHIHTLQRLEQSNNGSMTATSFLNSSANESLNHSTNLNLNHDNDDLDVEIANLNRQLDGEVQLERRNSGVNNLGISERVLKKNRKQSRGLSRDSTHSHLHQYDNQQDSQQRRSRKSRSRENAKLGENHNVSKIKKTAERADSKDSVVSMQSQVSHVSQSSMASQSSRRSHRNPNYNTSSVTGFVLPNKSNASKKNQIQSQNHISRSSSKNTNSTTSTGTGDNSSRSNSASDSVASNAPSYSESNIDHSPEPVDLIPTLATQTQTQTSKTLPKLPLSDLNSINNSRYQAASAGMGRENGMKSARDNRPQKLIKDCGYNFKQNLSPTLEFETSFTSVTGGGNLGYGQGQEDNHSQQSQKQSNSSRQYSRTSKNSNGSLRSNSNRSSDSSCRYHQDNNNLDQIHPSTSSKDHTVARSESNQSQVTVQTGATSLSEFLTFTAQSVKNIAFGPDCDTTCGITFSKFKTGKTQSINDDRLNSSDTVTASTISTPTDHMMNQDKDLGINSDINQNLDSIRDVTSTKSSSKNQNLKHGLNRRDLNSKSLNRKTVTHNNIDSDNESNRSYSSLSSMGRRNANENTRYESDEHELISDYFNEGNDESSDTNSNKSISDSDDRFGYHNINNGPSSSNGTATKIKSSSRRGHKNLSQKFSNNQNNNKNHNVNPEISPERAAIDDDLNAALSQGGPDLTNKKNFNSFSTKENGMQKKNRHRNNNTSNSFNPSEIMANKKRPQPDSPDPDSNSSSNWCVFSGFLGELVDKQNLNRLCVPCTGPGVGLKMTAGEDSKSQGNSK